MRTSPRGRRVCLDRFLFWHFADETAHGAHGHGVGRALLRAAARAVKAEDGGCLQLAALRRNAAARACCAKVMEEDRKVTVFFAA